MQFLDPISENQMPAKNLAKTQWLDSTVHLKSPPLSASQTAPYN